MALTQTTINKSELARNVGVSSATIHRILKGERRAGPKLAIRLEIVTGVEAPYWVWPQRYGLKQRIKEVMGVDV